jgi:hypothetical protein
MDSGEEADAGELGRLRLGGKIPLQDPILRMQVLGTKAAALNRRI